MFIITFGSTYFELKLLLRLLKVGKVMFSRMIILLTSESSKTFIMVPDVRAEPKRLIIITYCNSWDKMLKGISTQFSSMSSDMK